MPSKRPRPDRSSPSAAGPSATHQQPGAADPQRPAKRVRLQDGSPNANPDAKKHAKRRRAAKQAQPAPPVPALQAKTSAILHKLFGPPKAHVPAAPSSGSPGPTGSSVADPSLPSAPGAHPPAADADAPPAAPPPGDPAPHSRPAAAGPPQRRPHHPGTVRKRSLPSAPAAHPTALSGHRLPNPPPDLAPGATHVLELWVSKKTSFTAHLKRALTAFRRAGAVPLEEKAKATGKGKRKGTQKAQGAGGQVVKVKAMGAAVGRAISLALAIEDALEASEGRVEKEVQTGSLTVVDDVLPDDLEADIIEQERTQSTLEITLRLRPPSASATPIHTTPVAPSKATGEEGAKNKGQSSKPAKTGKARATAKTKGFPKTSGSGGRKQT